LVRQNSAWILLGMICVLFGLAFGLSADQVHDFYVFKKVGTAFDCLSVLATDQNSLGGISF